MITEKECDCSIIQKKWCICICLCGIPASGKTTLCKEFCKFVQNERRQAICDLIDEEQLSEEITRELLSEYEFSEKLDEDLIEEAFKDKTLLFMDKMDKIEKVKAEKYNKAENL